MIARSLSSKTQKSTYKPHIQKVAEGAYTCQSEKYVHVLYLVSVHGDGSTTCECTAGQHSRDCKHQKSVRALVAYNARPQHIKPMQTWQGAEGLLQAFGA